MTRSGTIIVTLGAVATATAAAVVAAVAMRAEPAPASTRIALIACGISSGPPELELPLGALLERAAPVAVTLGPFEIAGVAEPVTLRFRVAASIDDKAPSRHDGVVELPVLVAPERPLEQVTLRCRHGHPARVDFRYGTQILALDIEPGSPAAPIVPGRVSAHRG